MCPRPAAFEDHRSCSDDHADRLPVLPTTTFSNPLIISCPISKPVACPVFRSIKHPVRRLRIVERIGSSSDRNKCRRCHQRQPAPHRRRCQRTTQSASFAIAITSFPAPPDKVSLPLAAVDEIVPSILPKMLSLAVAAADFVGAFTRLDHLEIGDAVTADFRAAGIGGNDIDDDGHEGGRIIERVDAFTAVIGIIGPIQGGCDRVIAGSAGYSILPRAIGQMIVAVAAGQDVIAACTLDQIIAALPWISSSCALP